MNACFAAYRTASHDDDFSAEAILSAEYIPGKRDICPVCSGDGRNILHAARRNDNGIEIRLGNKPGRGFRIQQNGYAALAELGDEIFPQLTNMMLEADVIGKSSCPPR